MIMENNTKKQYPAFAVLAVIALVAALMLALTNALTEGPIAAHQKAALEAAYGAVMTLPEGGSYVQVTEGLEGYEVSSLYKAQDANGSVIGYCVTASKKGYGGPVAVTFGVDANGLVTGCVIGDTSFAESAGFGTRAQTPEFQEQFVGLDAVNGGTFEKLSGATVTSTAVLGATNEAFRCVSEVCLGKPVEGGALVSFGAKQAPQVDTSALVPGSTMKGSADGFNGEPVKVTITLDDNCAIETIKIDASTQTPGFGQRCAEDADFLAQFIGKTLPVTVDALSGATITSDAVADAINGAEIAEPDAVTVAAPVATVIAQDNGASLGLYEDGTVSVVGGADFTGTVTVTLNVVDGKVQDGAVASKLPGTPDNETLVTGPGFNSDPVSVYVTQNEDGTLATVRVDASNQMAGIGKACEAESFTSQFVGKKGPFELGNGIDACSGATYTSQGVVDALNTLFPAEEAAPAVEPAAEAAPAVEETKVSYAGFDGDLVHVYVTQNEDGTLATVRVDASTQMAGIGKACEAESFTSQFIGKKGPFELGNGIDACSGATYTSQGVVKALNRLFPDEEPAAEAANELKAEAPGFNSDPVKVTVTMNEDGSIATLVVDASNQMAGIGKACEAESFTSQFVGKKGPFELGNGIDACTGATYTSQGVVDALNTLFPAEEAAPAVEPAAEAVPAVEETKVSYAGFDGDLVHVYVTQNEDGTLATVRVDASTQMAGIGKACEAESFTSQFIGKKGPFELGNGIDACSGATYTSQGVVKALNRLFPDEEPAAEAANELKAEAPGFNSDPVKVTVTMNEDGSIATLVVDASNQMAGIGKACEAESFTSQFIGKKGPFELGNGIDACSGATYTSQGVVDALNRLFPAE